MAKLPVALDNALARPPIAGRLRAGTTVPVAGKNPRPVSIDHWRVTTPYKALAEQVAQLYGGNVAPWADGPRAGEWVVDTEARELAVLLPPNPLGDTPIYELWDGKQCARSCSGAELVANGGTGGGCWTTIPTGPEVGESVESDCICRVNGELECKPTTRLDVILADIDFAGVWRLTTHSDLAREELPGMVEALAAVSARGFAHGFLCLTHRSSMGNDGKMHKYQVPTLRLPTTLESLASGGGTLRGIPAPADPVLTAPAELPSAPVTVEWEDEATWDPPEEGPPLAPIELVVTRGKVGPAPAFISRAQAQELARIMSEQGCDEVYRHFLVSRVTDGRTRFVTEIYPAEMDRLLVEVAPEDTDSPDEVEAERLGGPTPPSSGVTTPPLVEKVERIRAKKDKGEQA